MLVTGYFGCCHAEKNMSQQYVTQIKEMVKTSNCDEP